MAACGGGGLGVGGEEGADGGARGGSLAKKRKRAKSGYPLATGDTAGRDPATALFDRVRC